MAHVLDTPVSADRVLYEEKDDTYQMGIGRTMDDRFIGIAVETTVSDDERCAPAAAPSVFTGLAPRTRELRYSADHPGSRQVVRTNRDAKDYKLVTIADADVGKGVSAWRDLTPASNIVFIDGFVAIDQRDGSNRMIRLLDDA